MDAREGPNKSGIEVQPEATIYLALDWLAFPMDWADNPTLYRLLQKETSE